MLELLEVVKLDGLKTQFGIFKCSCGTVKRINRYNVNTGKVRSCGCLLVESRKSHGMWGTTTYQRWEDMKGRCRPTAKRADRYYDRGIGYPPEWEKFEGFYADMGECQEGLELDRIDNDKGYSKDNCRWASRSLNMRNRTETNRRGRGSVQNVHWAKREQKWLAYCSHNGKRKHIGYFDTEEDGRQAYNVFAAKHGYPLRDMPNGKDNT